MLRCRIVQAANDEGLEIADRMERTLGPRLPPAGNNLTEVLAAIDKCLAALGRGRGPAAAAEPYAGSPDSLPAVGGDGTPWRVIALDVRRRGPH